MYAEIANILKSIGSPRILIIGDIMLDEFLMGSVGRISPEAPTPILSHERNQQQLGGAGFTANVLAQLGAKVEICALTGQDETRESIINLLDNIKVDHRCLVVDADRPSTKKQRVMAQDSDLSSGQQQMLRIDYESKAPMPKNLEAEVIAFLKKEASSFDSIILSDYSKGMLSTEIIHCLKDCATDTPVIGDPAKGAPIERYHGITAMKPNRHECEAAVGFPLDSKESIIRAGKSFLEKAGLKYTFISLDTEGLFYIDREDNYLFVPTRPLEVYDVAGAGDSVISIMALLAASDTPPRYLLEIANAAAGIMISQQSPKHISREDLIHRMVIGDEQISRKIKSLDELSIILQSSSMKVKKTYFTNGYFDNISPKQILFLEKLNQYDGIRILAVNSDKSIRQQGHKPHLPENDRLRLLQMFDCIDYILLFDETDCIDILRNLAPDFYLKGANYRDQKIIEADILKEINCEIQFISINAE